MKKFSLKKNLAALLVVVSGLCMNSLFAQIDMPEASGGGTNNNSTSANLVGGYSSNFWKRPPKSAAKPNFFLFVQSPSWDETIINSGLYFAKYLASLSSATLTPDSNTTTALKNLLNATRVNTVKSFNDAMKQYFPLASSDQNTFYNFDDGKVNHTKKTANSDNKPASAINSLNLNALIEPAQYGTSGYNNAENAEHFIKYLSNQYSPAPLVDFSKIISDNKLDQVLQMPSVQQYLYTLREMVASYSVGMSDLYYLYQQRVPTDTDKLLGSSHFQSIIKSNLPENLQKKASPLALEQWMAEHRLVNYDPDKTNPKTVPPWVVAMENATPATLQRETVYLLAEIRYEMFQDRMLRERMLATMAAQQMQSMGTYQVQLQQLQTTICSNKLFKGSSACPPEPQASSTSTVTGK